MNIVHVVDYLMPEIGYQEYLLPKWMARDGHDVTIVCADRYAPIPEYANTWASVLGKRYVGESKITRDGLTIIRLRTLECLRRPWLHGLVSCVAELKPDLVFCHGSASFSAFRLALSATLSGTPLVMDNHQCFIAARGGLTGKIFYFWLKQFSQWVLNPRVELFLGVATECCDFLRQMQGIRDDKIRLLPLGVDTDIFNYSDDARSAKRKKYNIPNNGLIIMQTGKLDMSRRPDWLASAVNRLWKKYDHIFLVYVGQNNEETQHNVYSHVEASFHDRIRFIPFVPQWELGEYFNMADICVYPDSSSLSCFEAASSGCAVVVNDLPASAERAREGIAIKYRRGNIDDLASQLFTLIDNEAYRKEVVRKARETVLEKYSYQCIAKVCDDILRPCLKSELKVK